MRLEEEIGYTFQNTALLAQALVHSSFSNEHEQANNERLEFLGDAVLELVSSEFLYAAFPEMQEGDLTRLRASVVCEPTLAKIARKLSLSECLIMGRGAELNGDRKRDSVLADALEAVFGSVFLDGGIGAAQEVIIRLLGEEALAAGEKLRFKDFKSALQEHIQKTSAMPLTYRIISESGPDHNKAFTAQVFHGSELLGTGQGKSKKEAEQRAAQTALAKPR